MAGTVQQRRRKWDAQEQALQEEQAFALFARRVSLTEIAARMDISVRTAQARIQAGIRAANARDRKDAVEKDLKLIDIAIERVVDLLDAEDSDTIIKASNALMTALKRRSMLLGLDAPTQVLVAGQVEVIATIDPRIAEARELLKAESTRLPVEEVEENADQPALPAAQS
jgi:DNA-binding CsgD family transcriptional regulator